MSRGSSPLFGKKMEYTSVNMLSVIKNGIMIRKSSAVCGLKPFNLDILYVFYKEGYINGFRSFVSNNEKKIEIYLKYHFGKPVISELIIFSTISRRIYISCSTLWKLDTSTQTLVLSTSKGVLSGKDAKKSNVGGELICLLR
jgi:small subunit ribosomal protein S8